MATTTTANASPGMNSAVISSANVASRLNANFSDVLNANATSSPIIPAGANDTNSNAAAKVAPVLLKTQGSLLKKGAFFFQRQASLPTLPSRTFETIMKPLFLLLLLLTLIPIKAATLTTNEIFVRLQAVIETDKGLGDLVSDLENLENKELVPLLKEFDHTWPQLRDRYLKDHNDFVKSQFTGEAKAEANRKIRQHRKDFMMVYHLGENAMKPLLKTKSMPAIEGLKRLIMPDAGQIFATAPAALDQQRKIVLTLAKFRDAIVDTAVLHDEEKAEANILSTEKEAISSFAGLPRDGLRIIKENDKIAEKENIPADERKGIREVNEWRLLLGLNALLIDSKLCDASRGHSEDMAKNNFFAHESPIAGKKTPWDRAANEGTKASGENIYMGSTSPASANKGWFYSPGHHKNMFKGSHKRIGLGRYGSHWTQMFG